MKTKTIIVWSLSTLGLVASFGASEILKCYVDFYAPLDLPLRLASIALYFASCFVVIYAEHYPHRWPRYIGFFILLALIGLFAPHRNSLDAMCYSLIGCAPLVLISAMWLVKRYWTIKVTR